MEISCSIYISISASQSVYVYICLPEALPSYLSTSWSWLATSTIRCECIYVSINPSSCSRIHPDASSLVCTTFDFVYIVALHDLCSPLFIYVFFAAVLPWAVMFPLRVARVIIGLSACPNVPRRHDGSPRHKEVPIKKAAPWRVLKVCSCPSLAVVHL